mmetsp:Transcript_29410/g.44491  ORF Transcript_29410/g.44491 Transcript_29410/m.44491 type:complete len:96 (+) Transcript_29410:3788-4075(+)|eukprot:CAMPEP_0170485900 /NCGR_PEP_ID=MMETSP0208-20121228/5048_1 /TAXON_ID=197538 /ORGANISM="Strombidium inclinatum, Strain S3" /LENGTH=95 /DNA_ID=CAMNT_0010759693 /DNA_START=3726 /DNA_END=4013 /DNA_ORIENTATION=+
MKWCFSAIPILPVALLDMLEAPVPLIAGITAREYEIILEEDMLDSELHSNLWVHLEIKGDHPIAIVNEETVLGEVTSPGDLGSLEQSLKAASSTI